jgi:hypothetical protein
LATCVPYLDARAVMDRLDEVVGPGLWRDDYKEVNGRLMCGISIFTCGEWVTKWDTGTVTQIEGDKGIVSDSFKRAAVKWGVGRFLYSTGTQFVPANKKKESGSFPFVVDGSGKRVYEVTEYINSCLAKTQPKGEEEKKFSDYWETAVDGECNSSKCLTDWWNNNTGTIGRYLDSVEEAKLLRYLTQIKHDYWKDEYHICQASEEPISRFDCEKSECKAECELYNDDNGFIGVSMSKKDAETKK